MKHVHALFQRLNDYNIKFINKFPQLKGSDDNVKILHLGTMFTQGGIYRSIIPSMEMNQAGFSSILQAILENNNNEFHIESFDIIIKRELIEWADYIIMPPITQDIRFFVKEIKNLNKNATICMDMDRIYHLLPAKSNDHEYYTVPMLTQLVKNISWCDMLICADKNILDFYAQELAKEGMQDTVAMTVIPNLVSHFQFDDVVTTLEKNPELINKNKDIFKVMIHAVDGDYNDVNANRDILQWLLKEHRNAKIYLFGKDLSWKSRKAMRDIPYEFIPMKSKFSYLIDMARINPDVAFIPISHRDDYYRTNYKFLELGALGIPIITYDIPTYKKYKDFLLLGEKKKNIKERFNEVIEKRDRLDKLAESVNNFVWEELSFNEKNFRAYQRLFGITQEEDYKDADSTQMSQGQRQTQQRQQQPAEDAHIPDDDFLKQHGSKSSAGGGGAGVGSDGIPDDDFLKKNGTIVNG